MVKCNFSPTGFDHTILYPVITTHFLYFLFWAYPVSSMLNNLSDKSFPLTTFLKTVLKYQPILCCFCSEYLNDLIGSQYNKSMLIHELVDSSSSQEPCWSCNPIHQKINIFAFNENHILKIGTPLLCISMIQNYKYSSS